jgi:uncharacterized protein
MAGEEMVLPLFPLGTALVPGMVMPLHLFELRYRELAADLQHLPDGERRFGIVGIRAGSEVGQDVSGSLYPIGTVAEVTQISTNDDDTVDLNAVGSARFKILELRTDKPYLTARVELIGESDGEDSEGAAPAVRHLLAEYRDAVGLTVDPDSLDPQMLSYVVTAAVILEPDDKQALLASEDTTARLRRAQQLLTDELRIIRAMGTLPATELLRAPMSVN